MSAAWQDEVLGFWFGLAPEQWWKADPALDVAIRERFLDLWERERENLPEAFLGSPGDAVAAVILFDQFPRNMFRGHADQFSTDPLALAIAKGAIECGLDEAITAPERGFLYMPFQHSENIADQRRSLALFTALGDAFQLGFAQKHHDVIARFGRFPHRNDILGRAPRADEVAAGDVVPGNGARRARPVPQQLRGGHRPFAASGGRHRQRLVRPQRGDGRGHLARRADPADGP